MRRGETSQLTEELIVKILTYLPVKSLIRSKCVCKTWYFLISSSRFAKWHLRCAEEENNVNRCRRVLLFTRPFAKSFDFEKATGVDDYQAVMELKNYPDGIEVDSSFFEMKLLGCCNGLVCLSKGKIIALWNPSTNVSKILPNPSVSIRHAEYFGLGYDDSTDDYKLIIRSVRNTVNDGQEHAAEIFTLKSKNWRRIQDDNSIVVVGSSIGTYLNQQLHWIGYRRNDAEQQLEIVTFDIREERFKRILRMPDDYYLKSTSSVRLGVSRNHPCVFHESQGVFEASVVRGLGFSATWTKLFRIPHTTFGLCKHNCAPLCLTNKGEVLVDFDGRNIGLYNPYVSKTSHFRISNDGHFDCGSCVYLESLVSPCR